MSSPAEITLERTISAAPDQVSSDLGGEAVILNLKNGTYYGLNEVGAFVWERIQQPQTALALRDMLLAEYEVEVEQCEQDLLELLSTMAAHNLIEVR